jgi:hypothetical protein
MEAICTSETSIYFYEDDTELYPRRLSVIFILVTIRTWNLTSFSINHSQSPVDAYASEKHFRNLFNYVFQ